MMSDFCPPLKPEQTSTRASEQGGRVGVRRVHVVEL